MSHFNWSAFRHCVDASVQSRILTYAKNNLQLKIMLFFLFMKIIVISLLSKYIVIHHLSVRWFVNHISKVIVKLNSKQLGIFPQAFRNICILMKKKFESSNSDALLKMSTSNTVYSVNSIQHLWYSFPLLFLPQIIWF